MVMTEELAKLLAGQRAMIFIGSAILIFLIIIAIAEWLK